MRPAEGNILTGTPVSEVAMGDAWTDALGGGRQVPRYRVGHVRVGRFLRLQYGIFLVQASEVERYRREQLGKPGPKPKAR